MVVNGLKEQLFTVHLHITSEKNIMFVILWRETLQPSGPTYSINTITYGTYHFTNDSDRNEYPSE